MLERIAWECPRTIYVMMATFQKQCHPDDVEFGNALEEAIGQMDQLFIARKWSDKEGNARSYKIIEDFVSTHYVDHPIQTPSGPINDICSLNNHEQVY